ncbi:multiple sugar transport system permease protein [Faunimonas pinastri]|uniref:Multiple sugar transport system permease protein n=1 Tax=Faunimonas pinastri TaxID=1855383 RepID=A0A1H9F8G7_9HYPH|nr:carbohydrate ABC transporter permease [Faunimonas pinastri]SEQ34242.1 multiple sugar transport system permease protein [Faunimonas pinastri]
MKPSPLMMAVRWLVLVVAALVLNFPIISTLITSLKSDSEIASSASLIIQQPTLENYRAIFAMSDRFDMLHYLANSFISAGFGAVLSIVLAFPAAYAMVRFGTGERWLLPIVTNLRAIPLIIFSIPLYLIYQQVHLLDTRFGLGLILCLINLPLVLILIANALRDMPKEIEEAARVDGLGTMAILTRVVFPLAKPALASSLILSFIYSWNEFLFGLMLTTRAAVPVTVGASFFFSASGGDVRWGIAAAVMIVGTLPPLFVGLAAYKHIGRSMMAGAVKG